MLLSLNQLLFINRTIRWFISLRKFARMILLWKASHYNKITSIKLATCDSTYVINQQKVSG